MSAHNEQPAAAQEAVAWVPPSFFDNGVVAATARRKPPSETAVAMRGEYVPLYAAPVAAAPVEMSPEFTDTARAAIAWVLWHHLGGSSPVGQPLRFALGMGDHDPMPEWRIAEAKRYAEWAGATTAKFHEARASTPAAPGIDLEPFRLLVEGCEAEFTGAETEELEPDDSKVSYPEDRCNITFGMIRNARKALDASPNGGSDSARLDWLESEIRHYGDGHTEPREAYIGFNWQPTRPGEEFPGLRAAIDAAMLATSAEVGS